MMRFPERFRHDSPPPFNSSKGDEWGRFVVRAKSAHGRPLKVMACSARAAMEDAAEDGVVGPWMGWDHVSVSVMNSRECPTWEEMAVVKALFWEPEDCVVQFHPPESEYVNLHPGCLHLWRWTGGAFPRPPTFMV